MHEIWNISNIEYVTSSVRLVAEFHKLKYPPFWNVYILCPSGGEHVICNNNFIPARRFQYPYVSWVPVRTKSVVTARLMDLYCGCDEVIYVTCDALTHYTGLEADCSASTIKITFPNWWTEQSFVGDYSQFAYHKWIHWIYWWSMVVWCWWQVITSNNNKVKRSQFAHSHSLWTSAIKDFGDEPFVQSFNARRFLCNSPCETNLNSLCSDKSNLSHHLHLWHQFDQ